MPLFTQSTSTKNHSQEKIRKKDNQERLAKEELDSRDKHHKICSGILLTGLTSEFTLDENSFRQ